MGVAYVEIHADVVDALGYDPWRWQLQIISAKPMGNHVFLVMLSSPELSENCPPMQEMILEKEKVRFKRAVET